MTTPHSTFRLDGGLYGSDPEGAAAAMSLLALADALDALDKLLGVADSASPTLNAYGAVRDEHARRIAGMYSPLPDAELASVARMAMGSSWCDKTPCQQGVCHVVEQELRGRYPVASEAADEYLEYLDIDDEEQDEWAHLRIILAVAHL